MKQKRVEFKKISKPYHNSKVRKSIIIIAISILVIILSFFCIFRTRSINKTSINNYEYSSYSGLSEERQELWNKMKVSSAVIAKRVTGTSLNSSSTYSSSNMDGIDISGDDEYVKTRDYIYYTIELNIDANTAIDGVTDESEFYGGVIKYKVTLPTNEYGKSLFSWSSQNWMTNTSSSNKYSVYYGEYNVPSDTNVVGAVQQLTFTIRALGAKAELDNGPTFEFWMEGNEPDNESDHTSTISSTKVTDGELKITAKESSIGLGISDGVYKKAGYKDGVYGQYWTIGIFGYSTGYSSTGYISSRIDSATTKIRLDYYYKDVSPSSSTNNSWIKVNSGNSIYDNTIGKATILAYNRNGDTNENAYPNSTSNYKTGVAGFSKSSVTLEGNTYKFDSGKVTASISDGVITINNDNIDVSYMDYIRNTDSCISVSYLSSTSIPGSTNSTSSLCYEEYYFIDSIELFIPYTELGVADRDYQIRAVAYNIEADNSKTGEHSTYNSSSSVTTTYSDQAGSLLTGSITIDGSRYSKIRFGSEYNIYANFSADNGTYYGEERLINIDTSFFELTSSVGYYSNNSSTKPKDLIIEYGVYKADPLGGLNGTGDITSTEEINTSDINDFYWYSSIKEAKACEDLKNSGMVNESSCVVASIHIQNPSYSGDGNNVRYNFYIKAKSELLEKYKDGSIISGAIRQKARVFTDEDRTIEKAYSYYYDNSSDSYTPAIYNQYLSVTSSPTPLDAGATAAVYGDYPSISVSTTDKNGNSKSYFNISDDTVYYKITPKLYTSTSNSELTHDDYKLVVSFPSKLEFDQSTANVNPTKILKNGSTTYVIWKFNNCKIGGIIPADCDGYDETFTNIKISADISPLTANNTSLWTYFYYSSNYTSRNNSLNITDSTTKENYTLRYYSLSATVSYITNLSGSYARIKSSSSGASPNEKFTVVNSIYNNSTNALENIKTVQFLPKAGDSYGSNFSGNYTIKVNDLLENQKIYYTTLDEEKSGITYDVNGKITIENVDLENDDRWIMVGTDEIIPSTAKGIATTIPKLEISSSGEFSYEIIPKGNKSGDKFKLKMFTSSDSLYSSIATNTSTVTIYDRKIHGTAFNDKNRNNIYDTGEEYANLIINLYNEKNELIETTTTKSDGTYSFSNLPKDNYYVTHQINSNYEFVIPNLGDASVSSIINTNGASDLITSLNVNLIDSEKKAENINVGLRLKEATITVHHYIDGTTDKLSDDVVTTQEYTTKYTTSPASVNSNYELVSTPTNASGTVSGNIEVTYYYQLKTATLTVHHYIEGTTTSLIADEISEVTYTHTYTTSVSQNVSSNYELASTKGTLSGTVTGNIEVTYYYKLKSSTLTVKHLEYGTNNVMAPEETKSLKYTDEYETSVSTSIPGNYEYYSKTDNYKGIVSSSKIEVIYYYQKKDSKLSTEIKLTVPEEITDKNKKVDYKIDYETTISDYKGEGVINITANLPYHIDESTSELNGGIYNSESKTITWTITEDEIDASTESKTLSIIKKISITFSDLVSTDRIVNTSVTGNIKLDNNERNTSDTAATYIKIPSKIIIHHYIEGTKVKIIDDIESTNLVGETYVSEPTTKEGYILKKEPDNKNHIYQDEVIEVIYEYEKIKFNIITKVTGDGGIIQGDESVYYGENSTEDNIIIKPKDGYTVSKIIINGLEQEIKECQNGCVLNNFIDVQEDKEIIVLFSEIPDNPNTSTIIAIFTIGGLGILTSSAIILIKKYKPRMKKL